MAAKQDKVQFFLSSFASNFKKKKIIHNWLILIACKPIYRIIYIIYLHFCVIFLRDFFFFYSSYMILYVPIQYK